MIINDTDLNNTMLSVLQDENLYSVELKEIAQLQYKTGCRITEALEFNRWTLLGNGNIQLQPQKGNNLRVFDPTIVLCKYFDKVIANNNIYSNIFYRKYNYYLEKAINYHQFTIGNKAVSSHLFRHNYARLYKANGQSDDDIRIILGEVAQQSANHYIYSQIEWIG